ncbi:myo-inositol transporter itr1 [Rhizina undulata]
MENHDISQRRPQAPLSDASSGASEKATERILENAASTRPMAASATPSLGGQVVEQRDSSEKPTLWMWFLTTIAGISGLLFGYDTGVISGALVVIANDLGPSALSSSQKEFITAATSLGALLASVASGTLADAIGRKKVIAVADVIFIVGAIVQAVSHHVWPMIIGRFIIGLGVGLASLIVPLYIAELSPAYYRGRMIVINVLFITFGQVVAYAIGAGLEHVHNGWRLMVGIGAIPAGLQFFMLYFLPESPRYLVRINRDADAKEVLSKIYKGASQEDLDTKVAYIREFTEDNRPGTWWEKFSTDFKQLYTVPSNLKALIITCGLQGIQQFSGFNSLMYFSATIFQSVGFKNPTAVSMIVAGTNFVMTCIAFLLIDKIGRRRMLIGTLWGCAAGLTICAIAFHFLPRNAAGDIDASGSNKWAILVLVSQIIYVMFYALGIGNVPWVGQSEMFPYNVRGLGTGMATATNWAGNFILGATFLTMMERMTPSGAFGFYAGLCALGWLFVVFLYPDLSGFTLEEVAEILSHGFGIKESDRRRKELKRLGAEERRRREEALMEKV